MAETGRYIFTFVRIFVYAFFAGFLFAVVFDDSVSGAKLGTDMLTKQGLCSFIGSIDLINNVGFFTFDCYMLLILAILFSIIFAYISSFETVFLVGDFKIGFIFYGFFWICSMLYYFLL